MTMSSDTYISVQIEDFDVGAEIKALGTSVDVGAITTFTGLVRDLPGNPLNQMHLEHYPGMTEKCLEGIADQARDRWNLNGIRIIHRVGRLTPCDQIVLVVVSGGHRADSFAACEFIMDYLKKDAPFWKKELTEKDDYWVEQKTSDLEAADRWK